MIKKPINILEFPVEIIELIMQHLRLDDLKMISSTCNSFEVISWAFRKHISEIDIECILKQRKISIFKKTKKRFENVKTSIFEYSLEYLLKRISKISSIKPVNLNLAYFDSRETLPILEKYKDEIKNIKLPVFKSYAETESTVKSMQSILPSTQIFVKLFFDGEIFDCDKLNVVEVYGRTKDYVFHNDIYKVRKLNCTYANDSLRRFKNLRELDLCLAPRELLQDVIEINKDTLTKLRLRKIAYDLNYTFACQLEELCLEYCDFPVDALENQRNLRRLVLKGANISHDLMSILSKNMLLRKIEFHLCKVEDSIYDYDALQRVEEVKISFCEETMDTKLLKAIFDYCKKNTFINIEGYEMDYKDTDLRHLEELDGARNFVKFLKSHPESKHINFTTTI